ncbi:MAG: COG1470 family protein [Thermoplasmatota archaeon]
MSRGPAGHIALVALFALLSLAPIGSAQVPAGTTDCTKIALSHLAVSPVAPGQTVEITESIQNSGNVDAQVSVSIRTTQGIWTADKQTATATVAAGQSASVKVIVTAPGKGGGDGQLGFTATGTCSAGGNTVPPPVPVQPTTNTATDTVVLTLAPSAGFDLSQFTNLSPLILVAIAATLLIVVGAILAMRRGGRGFLVECPEPAKPLKPGRGVSFPIELKNRGNSPDTARFEVGEVPAGWSAFMAVPELQLAAGESRTLYLMVRAPPAAREGAHVVVPILVRSMKHEKNETKVNVRADVRLDGEGGATPGGAGVSA